MLSKQLLSKLKHDNQYCEYLNALQKDSEILEILKPYIKVYKDVLPNGTIYYFLNGLETDKETYDRVKEWLENDT